LPHAAAPTMILVFRGTHQVLAAEKRLKRAGVPMRLVPVPRELTSDCGVAIRIPLEERERAREILSDPRAGLVSVHRSREDGGYEAVNF
jgi:hypothetical protein